MANTILHKSSAVAATVPAAGSLTVRELALNTADGRLFTKTGAGVVVEFARSDATHVAASKTTPVDADEIPLADSAATFGLKKLTWANLKATAKAYFDTLYLGASATAANASTLLGGTWMQPGSIGGVTPSPGSFTNVIGTIFTTSSGTTALTASNVSVTAIVIPYAGSGVWLVSAAVALTGAPAAYNAVAIVTTSGTTSRVVALSSATAMTISTSGLNVSLIQTSGSSQQMDWTIMRIS